MNKFELLMNEEEGTILAGEAQESASVVKTKEEEILEAHEAAEAAKVAEKSQSIKSDVEEKVEPAPKGVSFDDATIAKMADAVASRTIPKQSKKEAALTREDLEKLKPVRVTKEQLADLFPDATDSQVARMQEFANAIVENSVLTSRFINQRILEQEKSQLAPVVEFYESQKAEIARKAFFETHKDIAKFPKFVAAAATRVSPVDSAGHEKNTAQIFTEVADLTREMLKEAIPNFGTDNANQAAATSKNVPQMAQLSGAGRSLSESKGIGKHNNPDADIYR